MMKDEYNLLKLCGLFALIVLLGVGVYTTHAAPPIFSNGTSTYGNAINLNVTNWNYTQGSLLNTHSDGFVLLTLASGSFSGLKIIGYSATGAPLGTVPFCGINQNGLTISLLVSNLTNTSAAWSSARVFYDPTTTNNNNTGFVHCLVTVGGYPYPTFSVDSDIIRTLPLATFGNSPAVSFNFTLARYPNFVLIGSPQLNTESFNTTWNSEGYSQFTLGSQGGIFRLTSDGLLANYVTNSPVNSINANIVFAGLYNAPYGFEAYYSTQKNRTTGEGLGELTGLAFSIYNSVISYPTTTPFSSVPPSLFTLTSGEEPFIFYALPSFTTQYTLGNVITNNAPYPSNSSIGQYAWYRPYYDVNWTYNVSTHAAPQVANTMANETFVFGANDVPYLMVNVTHDSQLGSTCNTAQFTTYNFTTMNTMGTIPFAIVGYTPSICSFILANMTSESNVYNSFNLLYGNIYNNTNGASPQNAMVLSNWEIAHGSTFEFPSNSLAVPAFVETLQNPLNTVSNVVIHYQGGSGNYGYINFSNFGYGEYLGVVTHAGFEANVIDKTGHEALQYVYTDNITVKNTSEHSALDNYVFGAISSYLTVFTNTGMSGSNLLANTTTNVYGGTYIARDQFNFSVHLTSNNATATYLFTQQYKTSPYAYPIPRPSAGNATVPHIPIAPQTFGNTTSGLNYSNPNATVNINYSASKNTTLTSGVTVPTAAFLVIGVIIMLLGVGMLGYGKMGHFPFVIMLLGLWITSAWKLQLVVVAIVATIVFVVFELTEIGGKWR